MGYSISDDDLLQMALRDGPVSRYELGIGDVRKYKKVSGNISDADVVIVYGDVKGNIVAAKDVIVINGDVKGNLVNCENVAGLLADKHDSQKIFQKSRSDWSRLSVEEKRQYMYVNFNDDTRHLSY